MSNSRASKEIESYIGDAWEGKTRFSIAEVKAKIRRRLTDTPDINITDPACRRHSIILVGEAGVGKSTILEQLCAEMGAEYRTYHHGATVVEDNHGLQVVDQIEGTTKHVVAAHMIPFQRPPKGGKGVFFIDEAANGSFTEHEVVLRMFIDGQCDEHTVHPGWLFVCASNPPTAKYSTVRQPDFSLEDRFLIMPIEVSSEDKLEYWSNSMPVTMYKFLLLNKVGSIDFIPKHSSRRWSAVAYDVEKDLKAGATHSEIIKFLDVNMGNEIATAFAAFLKNGSDPDKYPINHMEMLFNGDFHVIETRLQKWVKEKTAVPLIGATKYDMTWYLTVRENCTKVEKDKKAFKRFVDYLVIIGMAGYSDVVDDLLNMIAGTLLCKNAIKAIEDTPLGEKMMDVMRKIADTDSRLQAQKVK